VGEHVVASGIHESQMKPTVSRVMAVVTTTFVFRRQPDGGSVGTSEVALSR
jgi:hypothetical protein